MNNQKKNQNNTPLKEFNATPIDTPTPISIDDNLGAPESLTSKPISSTETSTQLDSDIKNVLEPQIPPESKTELSQEPEIKLEPVPQMPLETEPQPTLDPEVKLAPQPVVETQQKIEEKPNTDKPSVLSENPEEIKQKIEEVLSYNSANSVVNSKSDKPKTSRILKTLFTLSLIIFIGIFAALAYFYFNPISKTNIDSIAKPTETPAQSSIPTQSDVVCELNGFIYNQGQSFPSADGCNSCTCVSADTITCTEKACADVTTIPATSSSIPKDWKTYENKEIGFNIQYPASMKAISENNNSFLGVSFAKLQSASPEEENPIWEINFNSVNNKKTLEEIKKEIGVQFSDKIQKEEVIVINNKINATKITTTTKESPTWYSEVIIIKDTYNNIYIIDNFGISDEVANRVLKSKNIKYESFYSSFKFI